MVVKVRISLTGRPEGGVVIRQATTTFLCTSSPQQNSLRQHVLKNFHRLLLPTRSRSEPGEGILLLESFSYACFPSGSDKRGCMRMPGSNSLQARSTKRIPTLVPMTAPSFSIELFSFLWVPRRGMITH